MTSPISDPVITPLPQEVDISPTLPEDELSNSPFAKMFRGGATNKEVQKFIDQSLYMIALEIKRANQKWKKSQERLRKIAEGKRPDD